jgi:hypothetical protein
MGGKRTLACYVAGVTYDFNKLEMTAASLTGEGRHHDALRIYLFMADGDQSLDGGYLGERIGQCYEHLGELDAARYWYGRAIEENPGVRADAAAARDRLGHISITDLCGQAN